MSPTGDHGLKRPHVPVPNRFRGADRQLEAPTEWVGSQGTRMIVEPAGRRLSRSTAAGMRAGLPTGRQPCAPSTGPRWNGCCAGGQDDGERVANIRRVRGHGRGCGQAASRAVRSHREDRDRRSTVLHGFAFARGKSLSEADTPQSTRAHASMTFRRIPIVPLAFVVLAVLSIARPLGSASAPRRRRH